MQITGLTPLLAFAQTTTYDLTPADSRMPPIVWSAFMALNKVHGVWRWYRRVELYRNPDNLAQLLAGHVINFVIGDRLMVRIAAQCLLISTRILECVQQQTVLQESCQTWMGAIYGYYPKPCRRSWNLIPSNSWNSPSAVGVLKTKCESLWNYAERVVRCTADVFVQFFTLSMNIMDAMDTFCLSPHTHNDAVNEFVVNAMKWMDNLVENSEELLDGIRSNRMIIEKILVGSPITYNQLHAGVAKTLEKTEMVHRKVKAIADCSNGALIQLGKRALTGAMIVLGLPAKYLPAKLRQLPT